EWARTGNEVERAQGAGGGRGRGVRVPEPSYARSSAHRANAVSQAGRRSLGFRFPEESVHLGGPRRTPKHGSKTRNGSTITSALTSGPILRKRNVTISRSFFRVCGSAFRSGELPPVGGNEKHDLHVTPQEGCSEPIVQDLAQVVEEATGVPLPFQKLIFKGKSLKEMETPLSALGIQNGCRVMLIGKKNSPEEEVELKKLKGLERSVEKIADQLEELNKELTGIQQGFLAKDLQAEALCRLDRKVKATIEQFMKILEEIDTLILPENFKDSRLKRKGLVKRVQAFLAECDTVEQNICQETERLQSTNLALAE
uniref:BAG family molecular chaperone regulator 1 n=1 Tax=Equus caballus TaxID=9796 RepID=F6S0E7_HORSE